MPKKKIKIIGDRSLSKRDFKRVSDPLQKFGVKFKLKNNKNLPLNIIGTKNLKPIKYYETKGSAQCKSSVIFAALKTKGTTILKAKKSRNHTELLCKYLKLPIQKIISKSKLKYVKIIVTEKKFLSSKKINLINYRTLICHQQLKLIKPI